MLCSVNRLRITHWLSKEGKWLRSVISGFFAYHAVTGYWTALGAFRKQCTRHWCRTLRRRSHKSSLTWDRMNDLATHDYPHPAFFTLGPKTAVSTSSEGGAEW
jgi:hypothetical protein